MIALLVIGTRCSIHDHTFKWHSYFSKKWLFAQVHNDVMLQTCKPESKPEKVGVCRKGEIMTARILQIVVGIAGLCALVLGLFIWIANIDLTDIHMLFGLLVTLGLLVMSIIALPASGLRIWGIVGIVYAIIVLIFGVSQFNMLVGHLHWLIQTLHTLVGFGAIVLTGVLGARYMTLKRGEAAPAAESQALH